MTYTAYDSQGTVLWSGTSTTGALGWASFIPQVGTYNGILKLVATATAPCGAASSTYYRQSVDGNGIVGVVTNATTGPVTFRSPSGKFGAFSVPVVNGAFAAPSLESFAGRVSIKDAGSGRQTTKIITKDASSYSVALTAE